MIVHFEWGKVVTNDSKVWKDCIISTLNGSQNWDWKVDGTRHVPGITVASIRLIEDHDHIILSTGVNEVLQISPIALVYLKTLNKPYYILQSEKAVIKYNILFKKGLSAAMLLHSTC